MAWLTVTSTRTKIFGAKILYKLTTLVAGRQKRVIERGGIKYEVDLAEGIELSLFLFGKFQKHITQNAYLKIEPGFTIIDIGANVGLMTLQFARLVPQGRVYSFEPTFYALERLKKNLSLNPALAKNVTVINSFVSEKSDINPGILAYSSWKVNGEKSSNEHPMHGGTPQAAEGVPSVSLDDFVEKQGLDKIDFIKIDTDGHEYEVFKGAAKAIAKYRPKIIFEIALYVLDEKHITFDFYLDYFARLNYKMMDTRKNVEITAQNYRKYIPADGSTDLIAIPL
jgi:FkbM family methyltransferase